MKKIVEGVLHFQQSAFPTKRELFERLAAGQKPPALFITCSDSRIDPNLLTQTEPGDLFVIRNAGNIVPPYGSAHGGEAATIEYAVEALGVQDIIICGHSHCGAMGGLLNPDAIEKFSAVKDWLKHAEATARVVKEKFGDVSDDAALLTTAIEQNVLVQLANLQTHPSVQAAVSRSEMQLHGWTYTFETGQVAAYDVQQDRFAPIADGGGIQGPAV